MTYKRLFIATFSILLLCFLLAMAQEKLQAVDSIYAALRARYTARIDTLQEAIKQNAQNAQAQEVYLRGQIIQCQQFLSELQAKADTAKMKKEKK